MLFNVGGNEEEEEEKPKKITESSIENSVIFLSSAFAYLHKQFKEIDFESNQDRSIHCSSNGRWGLHDLIIFLLQKIGGGEVLVAFYSISLAAANRFLKAQENGILHKLEIVVNTGKKAENAKAIDLLKSTTQIHYSPVHAKVCVVKNDKTEMSIVSTGNLSAGGNIERVIIFFNKEIVDFDYEFIRSLYN